MKNKQLPQLDENDDLAIKHANKRFKEERIKIYGTEDYFRRIVIRRVFFVLGEKYRSENMLNAIANKVIHQLRYYTELPKTVEKIDQAIKVVFVSKSAEYWIRKKGWFSPNRIKDRFINKFLGE